MAASKMRISGMLSAPPTPTLPVPTTKEVVMADIETIMLRLYRCDPNKTFTSALGGEIRGVILVNLITFKDVLLKSSASSYFRPMLTGGFAECGKRVIDMEQEHTAAFELWLRLFHDTVNDNSYAIAIVDLWHAVMIQRMYNFDFNILSKFFDEWLKCSGGVRLEKFRVCDLSQLLFLTHEFDHAEAFAHVTRRLAYKSDGHITESNNSGHRELRLDHRIIGAINSARGSLKTNIHKQIYMNRRFLHRECSCKKEALFAFEKGLDQTRAWPLEEVLSGRGRISIQDVLNRLKTFSCEVPEDSCEFCSQDFKDTIIISAIEKTQKNFDGLCLDCIDAGGKRDWERDYHSHNKRYRRTWQVDDNCRIVHGQPSWYHSWLARREERTHFTKMRDNRKRSAAEMEMEY